jgi:hypothetical protein
MSPQGENVIIAMIGVVLLLVLIAGFVPFGAPVAAVLAPVPLILFIFGGVRKDLRHVRRHGWNVVRGSDGPNGGGGRPTPDTPTPQGPSGDGERFDWDAFTTQFWEHVDHQPVA